MRGVITTYGGVHCRVVRLKGKASNHDCIECGEKARHWAYDGNDPNEKEHPKTKLAFSLDVERYSPMCISCHKRKDYTIRKERQANKPVPHKGPWYNF